MEFPLQFVLSRTTHPWIEGWSRHDCRSFTLQAARSLPVRLLLDEHETEIGFAIGWPIDQDGSVTAGSIRVPFCATRRCVTRIEEFVNTFGGRYVFILLGEQFKQLYVDAGATLGVVYSPTRGLAGSSVSLLARTEPDHRVWTTPIGSFPDNRANQFYPAGLTIDLHTQRLLPNHYLDLDTWQPVRYWPKCAIEWTSEREIQDSVEEIAGIVRRHILSALNDAPRVYMPLTAGRDSRMLLACSRDMCHSIEYITFDYSALGKSRKYCLDLEISRQIAKRFGLKHRVIPVSKELPRGVPLEYLQRIGFSGGAGKSRDFFWACQQHLDMSAAWLTGFAGEVGRAFYWRRGDQTLSSLGPREILDRMDLPMSDQFVEAITRWLSDLATDVIPTILDLAYLEHRLGCWASPHLYGAAPFSLNVLPLCHRRVFELMLRLPPDYRWKQNLARDIIACGWPDLSSVPFNDYTGIKKIWDRVRRKIRWLGQTVARGGSRSMRGIKRLRGKETER